MPAALINNSDEDNNFLRAHREHNEACFSYLNKWLKEGL